MDTAMTFRCSTLENAARCETAGSGWAVAGTRFVTVCLLALMLSPSAWAQDAAAPATTLGQTLQPKSSSQAVPAPRKEGLGTRPIGHHVFKAIVEAEDPEAIKPGAEVDVSLVTLGEEGPKAEPVLKRLTVDSVDVVAGEPVRRAEESEEGQKQERAFARRIVGLIVNESQLEHIRLAEAQGMLRIRPTHEREMSGPLDEILHNFVTNLFQPLLLFFFMGFTIPLLHVPFEFPKALYQSLTIYLLVAIGWHGGELMAQLSSTALAVAGGLAVVGFFTNAMVGVAATWILRAITPMRKIDAVTVGAYYGSDSAGTFVTCLGILAALNILHDSYMPVMLAVMEIPGCLVGLFLVSRLRHQGMDALGNMPGEAGYQGSRPEATQRETAHKSAGAAAVHKSAPLISAKILHEVFLNPGLFLLFGGIVIGFISGRQALEDPHVVEGPNHLFLFIFKGALCLFLLEMGMTACERLRDLKSAGIGFILFGILAPNLFATFGMLVLHTYSLVLGHHFELGTYALFAVLCGAASYIAVPAVQRIAIPEASPTLPLAASLGLTFSWNVTLGIPIYIEIAKRIVAAIPVT